MESRESLEAQESAALKELDRANRARAIFDDELFESAVKAVKDRCQDSFATSRIHDDETRRYLRLKLDALNDVLFELREHVETGKFAEQQLGFVRKQLERFKRRVA